MVGGEKNMTETLRTMLIVGVIIYFIILIRLLKSKRLLLKYSLLWLLIGCTMAILVIFPGVLGLIKDLLGFMDAMNGLFAIAIGFIVVLLMALTSIVSKQSDRIKNLIQDNALLEKRIRELEERL